MERKFKIGDHVCVVNGQRMGKVGTIVGYGSSEDIYAVHLSGIGDFIFVEYDLVLQEKMTQLDDEKTVLVGDLKNGYSLVTAKEANELRVKAEVEREEAKRRKLLTIQHEMDMPSDFVPRVSFNQILNAICGVSKKVEITKVIFNNPATIVFWSDGKKTVVKCAGDEAFDEEKGLAMAISKRVLSNQGNYYNEFKKWLPEIEVCEDKGVSMVEACRKAHEAVETFNRAMKGDK